MMFLRRYDKMGLLYDLIGFVFCVIVGCSDFSTASSPENTSALADSYPPPDPGQSFREIRTEGRNYVDKTKYLEYLLDKKAKFCFLTRPKNYGKTIFLEMIESYFKGEKEFFQNLTIWRRGNADKFGEWVEYPVIHINFGDLNAEACFSVQDFQNKLVNRLLIIAKYQYDLEYTESSFLLLTMVEDLQRKFKGRPVVILIDDYDEPLRVVLKRGDEKLAIGLRNFVDGFYKRIKGCRKSLKLVFVTGMSKLSIGRFDGGSMFMDMGREKEFLAGFASSFLRRRHQN